jgi:hypothetical protein
MELRADRLSDRAPAGYHTIHAIWRGGAQNLERPDMPLRSRLDAIAAGIATRFAPERVSIGDTCRLSFGGLGPAPSGASGGIA